MITELLSKRGQSACIGKDLIEILDPLFYQNAEMTKLDRKKLDIIRETVSSYRAQAIQGKKIVGTEAAMLAALNLFTDQDQEELVVIFLSTKNQVLKTSRIFKGTLNMSVCTPREVFKEALTVPCAGFIMAHNHPSGDPTPSAADVQTTKRFIEAGEILGIHCLDHVVVARETARSIRDLNPGIWEGL